MIRAAPVNWRMRNSAGSTNGLRRAQAVANEQRQQNDGEREAASDAARRPAPVVHLDDRERQRADAAGDQQRAPMRRAADIMAGNSGSFHQPTSSATTPIGTLTRNIQRQLAVDQNAADQRAERRGEAADRGPGPHRAAAVLGREGRASARAKSASSAPRRRLVPRETPPASRRCWRRRRPPTPR